MTHHLEGTAVQAAMELLNEAGLDGMADAMSILINEAMKVERTEFLRAKPYERTEERRGSANGFKAKTVSTRLGAMELRVPQVRDVEDGESFYPNALERGTRSERALTAAIAEMYVNGVSTRKVKAITEKLCGLQVTSTQVSRATQLLDEELTAWRERPLGRFPYVILDARYERVRHGGCVTSAAVLLAIGVSESGKRSVLGVSVSRSEAEVHWREFLQQLRSRGLHGVELVVSDDHAGLRQALKAEIVGVRWQRCQFHYLRNAVAKLPKKSMHDEATQAMRSIFNAKNGHEAQRLADMVVADYADEAPGFSAWLGDTIDECLTIFELPAAHQRRLRTTNSLERLNREIKRRTRVATLFPSDASLLRLVTAVVIEITEDWETGRCYLTMEGAQ